MRAFILFTLIALSQAKHKEVQSRYFSYGYNKDFINMTIDGSNKTHLGAMRIWNYKKIPNLSVNIELKSAMSKQTYLDNTLQLCHLKKQRNMNVFLRFFFEMNENNFSFQYKDFKCPIQKSLYELKARPRPENHPMFFPSFVNIQERVLFTVTLMTRVNGQDEKIFYTVESNELKEVND